MKNKRTKIIFISLLFLFVFSWGLFFTFGIDFFWEDFDYFSLHSTGKPPNSFSVFITETTKAFLNPQKLFQIGFSDTLVDRPYQHTTNWLLRFLFDDNILFYRIFRAIIFSIIACTIFLIIKPISKVLAFLALFLYVSSAEVWLSLVIACDIGIYEQLVILLSIIIFLHMISQKKITIVKLLFGYFLILLFSQYAILARSDGRYLALIFILTLLLFRRNKILLHLPILLVLFILEIPILGFLRNIFLKEHIMPINMAIHNPLPLKQALKLAFENRIFPITSLGKFTLLALCLTLIVHLICLIIKKKKKNINQTDSFHYSLNEKTFIFMLWFFSTFFTMALSRNFNYDGLSSFTLYESSFYIIPFIIFLSYYIVLVSLNLKGKLKYFFIILCVFLLVIQVFMKLPHLNQFRGGWGNYFCSFKNTKKYIDNNSNNALVLAITSMHYKPFVFRHSGNKILNDNNPAKFSSFTDLNFIENKFIIEKYKDIFVINIGVLNFRGETKKVKLKEMITIDGDTDDLYDRFKRLIGRPSKPILNLYHFIFSNT